MGAIGRSNTEIEMVEQAEAETSAVVHAGVTCDKSGMNPIVGNRWHLVDSNYDLCDDEFAKQFGKMASALVSAHLRPMTLPRIWLLGTFL